ncbi:hypothetical protein PVAP13_4KG375903 [Panicum virgatum]|uniref:Uncharacterized protein n=1 Tax=Panicum virgatum TaxID=38727 RepID=A0A8T0TQ77_PANVG|nr:hypothetical protein PVAP13_4KG375903 [Panicum virgatum]
MRKSRESRPGWVGEGSNSCGQRSTITPGPPPLLFPSPAQARRYCRSARQLPLETSRASWAISLRPVAIQHAKLRFLPYTHTLLFPLLLAHTPKGPGNKAEREVR